jgi:hypothetical protein
MIDFMMLRFYSLVSEKLNIKFVDPGGYTGLPSAKERMEMEQTQTENRRFLKIPRRSIIIISLLQLLLAYIIVLYNI